MDTTDSAIEHLINGGHNLDIHGIFCSSTLMTTEDVCISHSLGECVINTHTNTNPLSTNYNNDVMDADGYTSLVTIAGQTKPIIVIKNHDSESQDYNQIIKLCTILHELGHAEDMILGKNFKTTGIDLVKAEAYAEIYSLRKLDKMFIAGAVVGKGIIAKRLLNFPNYSEHHKHILLSVVKIIPRDKLRRWARAGV